MRKALLSLLLLCGLTSSLFAQQGNTVTVRFAGIPSGTCSAPMFAVNDSNADFYDCKADGTWNLVSGGGGGTPAAPSGSVQFNNSGAFGAIPFVTAVVSDCDGFMDPCTFKYDDGGSFNYLFYGTATGGTMGNFFDAYYFSGLFLDDFDDGVHGAHLGLESADAYLDIFTAPGALGFDVKPNFESVALSRFLITTHANNALVSGDFVLSGGWGNTASVDQIRGSDNNPSFRVTSSGTGQGSNPTVAFTYHNGAFGNSSNTPVFVCQNQGGTGVIADVTHTETTTVLTMTYNGLAVTGSTYIFGCFGAVAGDN